MSKLEIALQKLIDDEGFENAKSSLGLTTIELIQKSNCKIDFTMANDIISDLFDLGAIPFLYNNCQLSYNGFSGVVDWICDWSGDFYNDYNEESTSTMATPFWDGNGNIPVDTELYQAVDSESNPILLGDLNNNQSYTSIEWNKKFDNLASYSMWIRRFYLPQVYYVIQKHLHNYRDSIN